MTTPCLAGWQLVLIAWGELYGAADINRIARAAQKHSPGLQRVVLITDRDRPGLAEIICQSPFPAEFLQPQLMRSGCQAKLAMFKAGVVPPDLPAVYIDLDTVLFGDAGTFTKLLTTPQTLALLQSAVVPLGWPGRLVRRLSGGRKYARGNSSVVVYHPAHCDYIATRFQELLVQYPDFGFRPMVADERFMSWAAQDVVERIPASMAVKFPTEFMLPWLWLGWLRGALPWVKARRARLIAVTLPGEAVKPETLLVTPDGAEIADHKGRRMIWSDAFLGPVRRRILTAIAGEP